MKNTEYSVGDRFISHATGQRLTLSEIVYEDSGDTEYVLSTDTWPVYRVCINALKMDFLQIKRKDLQNNPS